MFVSFNVGPDRGLTAAECDAVPPLMIVGGPNGAGKSTMLELLHRNQGQAEPGTHVMYISPNRPWRRSQVSAMATLGIGDQSYRSMIESASGPQFQFGIPQGMQFLNYSTGTRTRDSVDDVQSLVKVHIVSLENRRQRAVTAMVDAGVRGDELSFDAYSPMRRYVETLLPHLRFVRVDATNSHEQRVIFEKLDAPTPIELDLDDLSSGEKAVVALMFPFIEAQAERLMDAQAPADTGPVPTVLIDEPELHLHPALQLNLVAYMRELAQAGEAQFVLCTHSTTIIDSAAEGELYVLAPPATTGGNQLVPVANSAGKLEAVRELTGSAYAVTRCRPIVFVEGETVGGKTPADHRILELLVPESKAWVLVPAHGRLEAIRSATGLRDPALTGLPGLTVFALVDSDQGHGSSPDWVVEWPVAMQENLLLDSAAIWTMLEPHREAHHVIPRDKEELLEDLRGFVRDQREREVALRLRRNIARLSVHDAVQGAGDRDGLRNRVGSALDEYLDRVGSDDDLQAMTDQAVAEVEGLLLDIDMALNRFHGKELLDRVYERYAPAAGWSGKAAFAYNLASAVARENSDRLTGLLALPVRRIEQYVPAELVTIASGILGIDGFNDAAPVVDVLRRAREQWESGTDSEVDRSLLRAGLLALARRLQASGHAAEHESLLGALSELVV